MAICNYGPIEEMEVCDKCGLSECICEALFSFEPLEQMADFPPILELDYELIVRHPCPYCDGTNISPYGRDGGSCPHCFNGKVNY